MITLRLILNKFPEGTAIQNESDITKNINYYVACENIKIVSENNKQIAYFYDGVNSDADEINLNNYKYVYINEFERYTVSEFIDAYKVIIQTNDYFNKIVNINELKYVCFSSKNMKDITECIEEIKSGLKQTKQNNTNSSEQ